MMQGAELGRSFERWLQVEVDNLNDANCIDVHIGQLTDEPIDLESQPQLALSVFSWIIEHLTDRLRGNIVMLMIPLRSSDALDEALPQWESVTQQLSWTPPSIYVMKAEAYVRHDPALRYTAPMRPNASGRESLNVVYHCWRYVDDPPDEGWSRDLRVVLLVAE